MLTAFISIYIFLIETTRDLTSVKEFKPQQGDSYEFQNDIARVNPFLHTSCH